MDIAAPSLERGDMDLYIYSLKTIMAEKFRDTPGVHMYQAPATSLSLVLNPAPAPEGQLNPFFIKEVRFALNYIINREFVAHEIFKGMAVPMLAHVGPFDYDYLNLYPLVREYNISYQPELAGRIIKEAMTKAGALLKDGYWHYNGKRIELRFIIRVEDERREIGDLIRAELDKLGFFVIPIYHMFAPAIFTVYISDPQLFQWHLYTEGWGRGAPERYDFASINHMYAPWLGNMPRWQEVGYWQYQHPQLDELGKRIFMGDFTTREERNQLYLKATELGLKEAVRLWVATVINNFPAKLELEGVTEDVSVGPKGLWTLREAYVPGKQELTIGHLWVWTERTTWNPVGGFGDVYSVDIWKNIDLGLASLGVSAYLSVVETLYKINGTYVIKEPKTSSGKRRIALSPSLALVLRQHRAEQQTQRALLGKPLTDEGFVFAHPDGTLLDPSTVSHAFNKVIRRAGLPHIRLHDLRHTHATLLLQAGVHPKVVQERLGHSSIRVTLDTYSHVMGGLQEAAAQRFDDFLSARAAESTDVGKPAGNRYRGERI